MTDWTGDAAAEPPAVEANAADFDPLYAALDAAATCDLPALDTLPLAEQIEVCTQAALACRTSPLEAEMEHIVSRCLDRGTAIAFATAFGRRLGLTSQPRDLYASKGEGSLKWDLTLWADTPTAATGRPTVAASSADLAGKLDTKAAGSNINENNMDNQFICYDAPEIEQRVHPGTVYHPSVARAILTHETRELGLTWPELAMSTLTRDMLAVKPAAQHTDVDRSAARYGLLGDALYLGDARAEVLLHTIPPVPLSPAGRSMAVVSCARGAIRRDFQRTRLRRDVERAVHERGLTGVTIRAATPRSWSCRLSGRYGARRIWAGTSLDGALLVYVYGGPRLADVQPHAPALRVDAAFRDEPFEDGSVAAGAWRATPTWDGVADLREVTVAALADLIVAAAHATP